VGALKDMKALSDQGDEPKGILDSLGDSLPALLATFAASRQPAPAPAPQQIPGPQAPRQIAGPQAPAAPGPKASPVGRQNAQIELVMTAARRDASPELYAELVLDNTPDEQIPVLKTVLTGESWFAQLFGGYPDAEKLKPWLEQLRTLVLDAINHPEPDDSPEESAGDPDPQVNGAEQPEPVPAGRVADQG
jgi:hypothetical protein